MCVYLDEDGSRRYLLNKNHYKLTQKLRYECGNTAKSDAAVHTSSLKLDYDISKRVLWMMNESELWGLDSSFSSPQVNITQAVVIICNDDGRDNHINSHTPRYSDYSARSASPVK